MNYNETRFFLKTLVAHTKLATELRELLALVPETREPVLVWELHKEVWLADSNYDPQQIGDPFCDQWAISDKGLYWEIDIACAPDVCPLGSRWRRWPTAEEAKQWCDDRERELRAAVKEPEHGTCPACMCYDKKVIPFTTNQIRIHCTMCGMCGPWESTEAEAWATWDNLPRRQTGIDPAVPGADKTVRNYYPEFGDMPPAAIKPRTIRSVADLREGDEVLFTTPQIRTVKFSSHIDDHFAYVEMGKWAPQSCHKSHLIGTPITPEQRAALKVGDRVIHKLSGIGVVVGLLPSPHVRWKYVVVFPMSPSNVEVETESIIGIPFDAQ